MQLILAAGKKINTFPANLYKVHDDRLIERTRL